jgi:hypothetical protein
MKGIREELLRNKKILGLTAKSEVKLKNALLLNLAFAPMLRAFV